MAAKENNLDDLRAESEQLGTRIRRLGFVLIGLFIIVTVTITNAFEKVDVRDVHEELEQASQAAESAWRIYIDESVVSENSQLPPEEKAKGENTRRELWKQADQKKKEAKRKYDGLLKESFSITPSLLGSNLSLDLRVWIYAFPFIVIVSVLYISILRKKQKILSVLAAQHVKSDAGPSTLNRLTFSRIAAWPTPFSRTPSDIEQAIYLLISVFLVTQIISATAGVEFISIGLGLMESLQYMFMFLTVFFYASSYYFFTSVRLTAK